MKRERSGATALKTVLLLIAIAVMIAAIVLLGRLVLKVIVDSSLAPAVQDAELWREDAPGEESALPTVEPFDASASAYEASEPADEEEGGENPPAKEELVTVPVDETAQQLAEEAFSAPAAQTESKEEG